MWSPDGLTKDAVTKLKFPTKAKTKRIYLKNGVKTE